MGKTRRTNILSGILLIVLGTVFLVYQRVPSLQDWFSLTFSWPMTIILGAFGLLIIGLLTTTPEMVIPACIVGGIGGILYWQNATGNWESWTYIWALIPGFAGIGKIIAGVLKGNRKEIKDGFETLFFSAILFIVFGIFLGGLFHDIPLAKYWPLLLIMLGLWLFLRALFPGRRRKEA